MPRFRLRYQATDLEMPVGDFVIGRSSSCNLALDDALVSRRHAVLHVTEGEVSAEDLGSRNGVSVNGKRIGRTTRLRHLDRITIGSQEMVVLEVGRRVREGERPTGKFSLCDRCSSPIAPHESRCPGCGRPVDAAGRTLSGATLEFQLPAAAPEEDTRQADAFLLIGSIAEKALAMGRTEEAERMLTQHLLAQLEQAVQGPKPVRDEHRELATRLALMLAESLAQPSWLDYLFRLHAACDTLIPGAAIDRLYDIVRRVRYTDARVLRRYLAQLRARADAMPPADRFLLKRLEGLERVLSA